MAKKQAKKAAKKAAKQSKEQLVIAVLERARDLIKKGWTKGFAARSKNGGRVPFTETKACKFCAWGALCRAVYDLTGTEKDAVAPVASTAAHELGLGIASIGELFEWNDKQISKRPVLMLFDKAIARLEANSA